MSGGCEAKVLDELVEHHWLICGDPVLHHHVYACSRGHARIGGTCAAHQPVPGEVGCSHCYEDGYERPMYFELLIEL